MQFTEKQVDSFLSKITKTPDGCWLWTGYKNSDGYGMVTINGVTLMAHRVSFIIAKGEIPEGLVLDHFYCQNPPCVNPDHLEDVTQSENLKRGWVHRKKPKMQEQNTKKKYAVIYWVDEETNERLDRITNRYGGRSEIARNGLLKEIDFQEEIQGITTEKEKLAS